MKNSLREFQKNLGMSIIGMTLGVGVLFVIGFQFLIYSLIKSRSDLAQIQFDKAVQQQVSSLSLQVATLAGSSEFRSYVRAGAMTRRERAIDFLELIAPLRRASVQGVAVELEQDKSFVTEFGSKGKEKISFDICYIGDRLNAEFGKCLATISFYISDKDLFFESFSSFRVKKICNGCGNKIGSWHFENELLRLSDNTNFTVDFEPISPDSSNLQAYGLAFACLIIGYGFWIWRKIGAAITTSVITPINDLINAMKSGDAQPFSIDNSLKEYVSIHTHHSTASALARMTQMLAHDVRKPFSMLKTGLNLLQATSGNPKKFESNLNFLISEIDRASKSVDGMLTDVMEIGSTSTELIQEPASPESLIESTLGEVFRVYPKSKIAITYELNHTAMVNVHLKKVSRVFSNIVGNAVQAINESAKDSGSLWFKTTMKEECVQFCIGNSGSYIPPESVAKLFEAFFTSGKKGGTGLGLAIAQKVVEAHGGKIWCESSKSPEYPQGKVEFYFTLPIAKGADLATTANLPKHSDDITQMIALIGQTNKSKSESEFNRSEERLHQEVVKKTKALSRPLGLLIVDDESIYRSALAGWIEESSELSQLCHIHHANGSIEAFDTLKKQSIDLIITDIDMGPRSLSGFDLVKELRTDMGDHHFDGLIFVHSNRIVPDDHRRAGDMGADGFLPKPMAKGQLFKLLLQAIDTLPSQGEASPKVATISLDSSSHSSTEIQKPLFNLIAIIDDEDIFRDQWPAFLKGFDTVCYATAEDFVKDWDQISGHLVAVLTDKYLGSGMDGIKLGTMLRQKASDLVIVLSTSEMSVKNDSNIFDLIVDKDAYEEAPKIAEYLKAKREQEGLPAVMQKTMRSFDAQVRQLDDQRVVQAVIDGHLQSWEYLLKEFDEPIKQNFKKAMTQIEIDRLKHDVKGSITRIKILLRNLESGDMDLAEIKGSLRSRCSDLAKS